MWQQIQDAAALRQLNRRTPSETSNPMLGVGFCGCPGCEACAGASSRNGSSVCGASLAQQISRRKTKAGEVNVHRYYRCGRTPLNCNGVSIRADLLDELLEENFLAQWGDSPVTRRVFIPGEDRSHELDGVNESIARLRRESDAGLVVSEEDERVYLERMRSLIDRRTNLEATPVRAAGWVTEETGQTYREVWPDSDHRQLLIDAGIRFVLERGNPAPITHLYVPEDRVPIDL